MNQIMNDQGIFFQESIYNSWFSELSLYCRSTESLLKSPANYELPLFFSPLKIIRLQVPQKFGDCHQYKFYRCVSFI